MAELMGGGPHAKAITQTGKATAYRIKQDKQGDDVMMSEGIKLTVEQRGTLAGLLVRDDAYDWELPKGCEPRPGVLVTFEDGGTYSRVRICFECNMIKFTPGSWEEFDPIQAEMVQWVKSVFPDDTAIQRLGTDDDEGGL